jgi:hypothetical protein
MRSYILFTIKFSSLFGFFFSNFFFSGEHPAAMQHGEHGAGSKLAAWSWTLTMAAFALSYR